MQICEFDSVNACQDPDAMLRHLWGSLVRYIMNREAKPHTPILSASSH